MSDTIKSVDVPSVHGMVVLNPDGTNIGSTAPSSLPTAGNNPSTVYAYDGNGDLASITKTNSRQVKS